MTQAKRTKNQSAERAVWRPLLLSFVAVLIYYLIPALAPNLNYITRQTIAYAVLTVLAIGIYLYLHSAYNLQPILKPIKIDDFSDETTFGFISIVGFAFAALWRDLGWFTKSLAVEDAKMTWRFGDPSAFWTWIFVAVILAPVAEEIIFRGILMNSFMNRISNLQSLLLVMLLNALFYRSFALFAYGLLAGLAFGVLFVSNPNNIVICILSHMMSNFIGGYILLRLYDHNIPAETVKTYLNILLLIVVILLVSGVIHKIWLSYHPGNDKTEDK